MSNGILTLTDDQLLNSASGLIEALTTQTPQKPTTSLSIGGNACERAGVLTHCLRSVAQRSLSTPTTFLSDTVAVVAGADIFEPIVYGVTGALAGTGPAGDPIDFNDANVQNERSRISDLVLMGVRADVTVYCITDDPASAFDVGLFTASLEALIRHYTAIQVFWTADDADPWISTTDLEYFQRPGGAFVAVPPLMFKDRDPKFQIDMRVADKGANAGALPTVTTQATDVSVACSILVEALFAPDPTVCGDMWPGQLCPTEGIKCHPNYRGK